MNRIPLRQITPLLRDTFRNWQNDRAPRMGAALAYYMALSLAPIMVILLALTSVAFGAKAARGELVWQMQGLVGYQGARVIQSVIEGVHQTSHGLVTTMVGLAALFFGATEVVIEMRDAMNTIWKVPDDTTARGARGLFTLVRERVLSFAMVLGAGCLLLVSLLLNVRVAAAGKLLQPALVVSPALIQVADWVVSFTLITMLFAFLFKYMPAVRLEWRDVSLGAVLTALLFTAGKLLLGLYLGRAGFADSYGAAGSLVVFLVWAYYSAQVVFLGAEFTRVYALGFGSMHCAPPARLHLHGEGLPTP